jgi:hypothetical protein
MLSREEKSTENTSRRHNVVADWNCGKNTEMKSSDLNERTALQNK